MFASISLCLLLLASLGCHAKPNPDSGPMGKDGGGEPVPRSLEIQQYLEALKNTIRHIPISNKDSERKAEAKRKQMELIRQQVYETLASVESPRRGLDVWQLQRPLGSTRLTNPPRPCWGNLLTCLQAGISSNLHQTSFATPAFTSPCHGPHCDSKVQAKPLRRPMYTTARPTGGINHHMNLCKNKQAGCHHNRILPTYAPIRFNKLPTRRFLTTTNPASTISSNEKNQKFSTTPSPKYFTLPEKLFNVAFNPSTMPSVIDTVKPKDLRDDWIKLENELLGITVGKQFDLGLNTESSVHNNHSSVTRITTQSHIAKNENISTAKTMIMTGDFPSSDNNATTQPSYIPKSTSSQSIFLPNITFISNIPLTKSEGELTTSENVKEPITVTQKTAFYEAPLTTQLSPSYTRPQESKPEPYVPSEHLSPLLIIHPASHYTTFRAEILEEFLTTQVSLLDSTSQKSKVTPNGPVFLSPAVSPALEYTTLRTALDEVLLTTQINQMSSDHQESKSETLLDVDHLTSESTDSSASEYTTNRAIPDEDCFTTQISPIDTKPDLEGKITPIQLAEHFSTDSFISPPTREFSTLKPSLDISPLKSTHKESKAKTKVHVDRSTDRTISLVFEHTTLRSALDEDLLTTQIDLMDTKPDQESKTDLIHPFEHFTIDSFISPATEYHTLRTELDDVLATTQHISKYIEPDEETTVDPNLPIRSSPGSSIYLASEYPIIDFSLRVDSPTIWPTEDSTITLVVKEETVSKTTDVETPKQISGEEDSQSSEYTTPNENLSRSGPNIYLTTKVTEDSFTHITDVSGRTDADTVQTTPITRVVELDTTELSFETTTLQFESKTDKERMFYKGTGSSKYDPTTNVPVQEDTTDNLSFSQDQTPDHISYGKERSAFSDLENERSFRDGVWKFTSELENDDDRIFPNDEGALTSNDDFVLGHRFRRAVARELQLELHNKEAFINDSSLSFTTNNNSITFNATNIVQLLPIIKEGFKNNAFEEEDIRSMKSFLGEDALAEITETELLGDETSRIEEDQTDYEYADSSEEEIRKKRLVKIVKRGKDFAARLPESIKNNLTTSFIKTSRSKRSAGVQTVSEAAAILALLAEGKGAVQLDRADDEDDDDYEYYGYEDDEEYGDQYEDTNEEYNDNPSVKELILLGNKHRKRKEAKS